MIPQPRDRRVLAVILPLAAVFVVALVPRLAGVGLFLTADEKNWIGRGVEFVRSVREFRFNDTLQTTHPGIPTMWVTGLTSAVVSGVRRVPFSFDDLLTTAVPAQVVMAVVNSLLVAALAGACRFFLRPSVALVAGLVVALDPLLIGHGKLAHVDAFLTGFTVLSLLLTIAAGAAWREQRLVPSQRLLVASAITTGLAILSKIPGLILLPMAAVSLFRQRAGDFWGVRERARLFARWLLVVGVVMLILWPGLLWVPDPIGNIMIVKRDLGVALSTPHDAGDAESLSIWHYPRTVVTRTTVPTLAGLILALVFVLPRWRSPQQGREGYLGRMLLLFLVLFIVGMTFGAKKGDRYILPVFPAIDILATLGVVAAIRRIRPLSSERASLAAAAMILLLPLVAELVRLGPYALAHYNPLVRPNFSQELGWGEGLDQVATFLNAQKDTGHAASWYPEELRPLVKRPVMHINAHTQIPVGYVVLYRNMFGRPPDHPANDFIDTYFKKETPVFTATVNGLPYAWVYRRPVYSGTVGELLPSTVVLAEIPLSSGVLEGIDVYLATYSQRATGGTLRVQLRDGIGGPEVRIGQVPIRSELDNQWVRVAFPPLHVNGNTRAFLLLSADGTEKGRAPTIRTAPGERGTFAYWVFRNDERPSEMMTRPPAGGELGIRLRYRMP